MRNKWKRVETKKRLLPNDSPGVYRCRTSTGRNIYCYSRDVSGAIRASVTGLKDREHILSIGRE